MTEANVVSPSASSKAMHVLSAVPNQRWLLSVLVSCGVCQGLVVAVKIWSKRRQLRAPNKQHNGQPTSSERAGVVLPRDDKSVAAGNNDDDDHFEDAEAYALCNHISSHVLGDGNEAQQEPAEQQLQTAAPSLRALHLLRRWDVVLTRVCPLQHASSTVKAAPLVAPQQSLSLLFPGTFHAFEEDILHFLSTWSETVDKRLRVSLQNTLMMGEGGSGSGLWWHNMLVDVSWCVLFLIARRDCLVEFHVGVQVLRDTKYCSEHAVDKWVELHDVRVGGRHHFGFMKENNGLTQLFQQHFEKTTQGSHHHQHHHVAGSLLFAVCHHLNVIWNDQQRQYAAFTAQYRTLQWRGMRSLLHYVLISSPSKWGILSLSTLSSLAVAKLAVSGVWIRATVEVQLVSKVSLPPHSSSANSNHTDEELGAWKYLSYLVLWESLRLVALRLVKATTDKAIASWSAQERETRRRELYRCLVAQPLSYFDLYHYDDIEEVMFYVNDMEGVDVHVHTSLLRLQQSVLCLVQVAGETSVLTVAAASAGVAAQTVAGGLTVLLRLWWAAIVKKCSSQLNGGSRPVPSSPGATSVAAMPAVDDDDDDDEEVDMEELELRGRPWRRRKNSPPL
ncbi:Hypothetical protein, putative [Bodo saltans]|uniref:Uncharacterized protein n=1 Tax=Bodo saltans TaxID=75058 RepID=A0A0S4KM10_BODSA|nr:Hypothetical protein, putative [Bodo saltans]|eukprot:CUI11833.1 Hypothetical protein, putative [Bodo saltans]